MVETQAGRGGDRWRASLPRTGPGPYAVVDGHILTDGIEIVVAHHCNLRCRACAYLAPLRPPTLVESGIFRRDLSALSAVYHASEGRVLGGEPLLHPDLVNLLRLVRATGICDTIRVLTNGLLLPRMTNSFWESVDAVSVSMYPHRSLQEEDVAALRRTASDHGVRINFKPFRYFRESYSEVGTSDLGLIDRIYRTCQMANVWRCHTLWHGHLYRCPQSLFLPAVLSESDQAVDGMPLHDGADLLDDLLSFLESERPLWSCTYCLGSVGRLFRNEQTPRLRWRDAQSKVSEDLVDWDHLALLEANPAMFVPDASYIAGPGS